MNFSESRLRVRMTTAVKTRDLIIKGMIALLLCCSLNVHAAAEQVGGDENAFLEILEIFVALDAAE